MAFVGGLGVGSVSSNFAGLVCKRRETPARSTPSTVTMADWQTVGTKEELDANAGKLVVKVGSGKILVTEQEGKLYAVSNRCTHLGLPIEGKILKAGFRDGCVVCAAHDTAFDLATGEVKGEWAPKLPNLPIVGKGTKPTPLPTYECRITDGKIDVLV